MTIRDTISATNGAVPGADERNPFPGPDGDDDQDGEQDTDEIVFAPLRFVFAMSSGEYFVALPPPFRDLMLARIDEVRATIMSNPESPRLRRLFPTAYANDPALDEEYQRLMRSELVASRLSAFDAVEQTIEKDVLSEDELQQWMQSINAARLALAVAQGFDEGENVRVEPDDDRFPAFQVYSFLTDLLYDIIAALRAGGAVTPGGRS